jgi:cbb3-type cytochrome oxidase subunit 1
MPPLTRLFIKSALVYLVAALVAGALLALPVDAAAHPILTAFAPTYLHLLMIGWLTQLIFGVAYWMFPRYTRERPRGSRALAATTYATLNAGLLLRAVAEPAVALRAGPAWGWALAASAVLLWLASLLFLANTWGRVKER